MGSHSTFLLNPNWLTVDTSDSLLFFDATRLRGFSVTGTTAATATSLLESTAGTRDDGQPSHVTLNEAALTDESREIVQALVDQSVLLPYKPLADALRTHGWQPSAAPRTSLVSVFAADESLDRVEAMAKSLLVMPNLEMEFVSHDTAVNYLSGATPTMAIYVGHFNSDASALQINADSNSHEVPVLYSRFTADKVELGPWVFPGMTACLACYLDRVTAPLSLSPIRRDSMYGPDATPLTGLPRRGLEDVATTLALDEVRSALSGTSAPLTIGRIRRMDLRPWSLMEDAVAAVPSCRYCTQWGS